MKAILFSLVAALGFAACGAQNPSGDDVRSVKFRCENGEQIEARFFTARGTAVLVRHGDSIELKQQPSGSGFVYGNGPNTIRGKGDELIVEIGRMAPIKCQAQ